MTTRIDPTDCSTCLSDAETAAHEYLVRQDRIPAEGWLSYPQSRLIESVARQRLLRGWHTAKHRADDHDGLEAILAAYYG